MIVKYTTGCGIGSGKISWLDREHSLPGMEETRPARRIRDILIILLFNPQMLRSKCVQYLKNSELGYSSVLGEHRFCFPCVRKPHPLPPPYAYDTSSFRYNVLFVLSRQMRSSNLTMLSYCTIISCAMQTHHFTSSASPEPELNDSTPYSWQPC